MCSLHSIINMYVRRPVFAIAVTRPTSKAFIGTSASEYTSEFRRSRFGFRETKSCIEIESAPRLDAIDSSVYHTLATTNRFVFGSG